MPQKLEHTGQRIARKVRQLREERRWTQAELARELGMSQGRLSEIERGGGSFSAEQFLVILRTFNVGVSYFVGTADARGETDLQNALARLGARHLRESDEVVPDERLEDPSRLLREALVAGSPRLITALGPVLVANIDRVNLWKLQTDLATSGLERRFGWLVENVLDALRLEVRRLSLPRALARQYQRAIFLLETFLQQAKYHRQEMADGTPPADILDLEIRSPQTLRLVAAEASEIARAWRIVTRLRLDDFVEALRAARDDH